MTGQTTVLHDRGATAHYLNNVVFEFEVNSERLDGNFYKSSIDRCMAPEALNALEIHCLAVKVPPSGTAAALLTDQDREMPMGEPVFSVGLDDFAFKMSSCHLASSTQEMMRVKERRLLNSSTITPGKPCGILPIDETTFTGRDFDLEYTLLDSKIENCKGMNAANIRPLVDSVPDSQKFEIKISGKKFEIKDEGNTGDTHTVAFYLSSGSETVAKIHYVITRTAGATLYMRLTTE